MSYRAGPTSPEGSIAAIVGRTDEVDYVRRLIQQARRDMLGDEGGDYYWITAGIYQQVVGSWTEADQRQFLEWLGRPYQPHMDEGPNGFAFERTLSARAVEELAVVDVLP
ncbi:hypothetical protein [uncultured Sphingomonas sp.]|uniref:hypothetical protein n=1 Tax=uncultured Sphingomonas sp. TaxID=158754 RepID=UPI0025EC46D9|nr:hypothetical protein [uncultured Sphingomonas sp.]